MTTSDLIKLGLISSRVGGKFPGEMGQDSNGCHEVSGNESDLYLCPVKDGTRYVNEGQRDAVQSRTDREPSGAVPPKITFPLQEVPVERSSLGGPLRRGSLRD